MIHSPGCSVWMLLYSLGLGHVVTHNLFHVCPRVRFLAQLSPLLLSVNQLHFFFLIQTNIFSGALSVWLATNSVFLQSNVPGMNGLVATQVYDSTYKLNFRIDKKNSKGNLLSVSCSHGGLKAENSERAVEISAHSSVYASFADF